MKNKYQEALQNLYDMRSKLIDVSSKNTQWANNIKIYDFIGDQLRTLQELVDKMKSIEEDLGCPLEVVFKALKDGIIIKDLPKGYEHRKVILNYLVNDNSFIFRPSAPYGSCKLYLKDYKKTWWLSETKEE